MSRRQSDEKAEKEHEKEEKSWEEKWRRDPLSAVVWALILVWAGLAFLVQNLNLLDNVRVGESPVEAWTLIFTGAGVIVLLEVVVRLVMPEYRRPLGGTLIWGFILLGIGLGKLVGVALVWPLILIAIGVGALLRGFLPRR